MTLKNLTTQFVFLFSALTLFSCASYRPILDENEQYEKVGESRAEADIDQCVAKADRYLEKHSSEKTRKEMGRKALTLGAIGGVVGGLSSGNLSGAAGGALVGAGIGAGSVALGDAMKDKLSPDELKKRYVSNCLQRKNYQVIGWK